MRGYTVKVYVVQQADPKTGAAGALLAVKLTFADAHQIAKTHAPAKVTCVLADKTPDLNTPDAVGSRALRN